MTQVQLPDVENNIIIREQDISIFVDGTTIVVSGGKITLNLAKANVWTGAQTGTITASSLATGAVDGTTLILSSGAAQINLANANTWTGLQTFSKTSTTNAYRSSIAYATVGSSVVSTTSTTGVSTGIGVSVTPQVAGKALVKVKAQAANNTLGDGIMVLLYRSTTSIPAAGSAPNSGDVNLQFASITQEGLAGNRHTIALDLLDSGLTNGTKYYYYIAQFAQTGGTASIGAYSTILAEPM